MRELVVLRSRQQVFIEVVATKASNSSRGGTRAAGQDDRVVGTRGGCSREALLPIILGDPGRERGRGAWHPRCRWRH